MLLVTHSSFIDEQELEIDEVSLKEKRRYSWHFMKRHVSPLLHLTYKQMRRDLTEPESVTYERDRSSILPDMAMDFLK